MRAGGLWEEHLTPTASPVHPLEPFQWVLRSVLCLAESTHRSHILWLLCSLALALLVILSKVRPYLEASCKLGLSTSDQRAPYPPIRIVAYYIL